MRGVGQASAAATIVNALPTGVGCAIGLDLLATAEVDFVRPTGDGPRSLRIAPENRTPLVEAALRGATARYLPHRPPSGTLSIRSAIPVARGLKSSSAVASAVISAVARSAGADPPAEEVARLSAEVARASGVSATGAFDDAMAGLSFGFVLADNRTDQVLARAPAPVDWEAGILVPSPPHRPSPEWAAAFRERAEEGARVVEAARSGEWALAMRRNTELVESVLGYSYGDLRDRLRRHGAAAAGVSGLGPALVALAPRRRVPELLRVLARESGIAQRVGLRTAGTVRREASG